MADILPVSDLINYNEALKNCRIGEPVFLTKNGRGRLVVLDIEDYECDRAAIVNFMIGLDGYTISSGIFPRYLHGDSIISIPLEEDETMRIGYILNKDRELSRLGEIYVEALKQYQKD